MHKHIISIEHFLLITESTFRSKNKMWKHLFMALTILNIIDLSIQESCNFYCKREASSDKNCVSHNKRTVNASIHETEGIVDFQFDFECEDVTHYKIIVAYNENRNCNPKDVYPQHSIYHFYKVRKSRKRNMEPIEKCSEAIFPLLFILRITSNLLNILFTER